MNIQERISNAMADKLIQSISGLDLDLYCGEIEIGPELGQLLKDCCKDEEVRTVIRAKIIETIREINPKEAAKTLERTWGELLGEFLYKLVNTFRSRK